MKTIARILPICGGIHETVATALYRSGDRKLTFCCVVRTAVLISEGVHYLFPE